MEDKTCVFIGGKQIGVNCLKQLLRRKIVPKLVIGNTDDDGTGTWHHSLVKTAESSNLEVIKGKKVKDIKVIKKIKGIQPEIIF